MDGKRTLGELESSELLLKELYVDLRALVRTWSEVTHQTAQARMGYVGQHLVSVVTGYKGGKSGARGRDLIISEDEFAEIKTCYRVDQLGSCKACAARVAATEQACPKCGGTNLVRKDDSKWLISIRNDSEFRQILTPTCYYLALFDCTDLQKADEVRCSIWQVDPQAPGFGLCLIDYYLNIRANSKSSAPFNLWPFALKFYLMKPTLIYRSRISDAGAIKTELFPKRDAAEVEALDLVGVVGSPEINMGILQDLITCCSLNVEKVSDLRKRDLISAIVEAITDQRITNSKLCDSLAVLIYGPKVKPSKSGLPSELQEYLHSFGL